MSMIRYFNQRDKVSDRMVDQHMKHLAEEYKKANVTIKNQLEAIHRKYSVNGELSYAEMTKYNRLANLQKDVNAELGRISGITTKNTTKLAGDVYNESFFRTAYALEQGTGMDLGFGKLPTKQVEAAISNPYREIALDTHKQRVRNNIRRDITQGIIQGESYPQMAKRVQASLEQNLNNAERIARTEAHRAREVAALDSMEHAQDMGINLQKQWVSAVDQRTRDTHASMDGQRVAVDEDFISPSGATGPAPGELGEAAEVINCRCTSIAIIEGYEPEARRIRGEGIVEYRPYSEYAKEKGWPMKYSGPEPSLSDVYTNSQEAKEYMQRNYNINAEYGDLPFESIKDINETIEETIRKMPEVRSRLNNVLVRYDMDKNLEASALFDTIKLNGNKYSNIERLKRNHASQVANGYKPVGTTHRSIITHETGHIIDYALGEKLNAGKNLYYSDTMKRKVLNEAGAKVSDIQNGLSVYATSKNTEFFAEAFAEYLDSPSPRNISSSFGKVLNEALLKAGL